MKKRTISVRIMWSDECDKDLATEVTQLILETLREYGFKVTKSKVYSNRKNTGGRIYITVNAQTKRRRGQEEHYEEHSQ